VAFCLAATVVVDSVMWGRWLWPEGEVLWFNTAENKSSHWGALGRSSLPPPAHAPPAHPPARVQLAEGLPAPLCSTRAAPLGGPIPALPSPLPPPPPPRPMPTGTSPWHWYATSALPRTLLACGLFVPVGALSRKGAVAGVLDARVAPFLLPVAAFVGLYSFLPHKELRFLLPSAPLLYLVAAHGMSKM
jgi:hypothetical protein